MVRSLLSLLTACLAFYPSPALSLSYAELMAGLATTNSLIEYRDTDADRVDPGSFATSIQICGLFELNPYFSISPSYSYLSTDGSVDSDMLQFPDYSVRLQQSELAVDFFWRPPGVRKIRFGPGFSLGWWNAQEDYERPIYRSEDYPERRVTRGQSWLARGVVHMMPRTPTVPGISLKVIGAYPLTELLRKEDTSALGYIGISAGFSMILN